jgi:hypothetical protein
MTLLTLIPLTTLSPVPYLHSVPAEPIYSLDVSLSGLPPASRLLMLACYIHPPSPFALFLLRSPSGFPSPGWPAAGLRTCSGLGSAPAEASVARGMGGQPADACFGGNRDTPGGGGNGGYTGRGHSHGSGTHLSSGEGGLLSSSRRVNDAHTRAFLIRHLQLLFLWVLVYGLADATHFAVRGGSAAVARLLGVSMGRMCLILPCGRAL